MKIKKVVDRELTAEEIQSIKTFRKYTDGVSFAYLGNRVTVILDGVFSKDVEELKKATRMCMAEALGTSPDFTVYDMNDGHVLLGMPSGLCAFTAYPCRASMYLNLALRAECLSAAEEGEIIAVAYEDPEDTGGEDEYDYMDEEEYDEDEEDEEEI